MIGKSKHKKLRTFYKVWATSHGSNIESVKQDIDSFLDRKDFIPEKEIVSIQTFLNSNDSYSTVIVYTETELL